jgi:hypothetical protein
VRRTRANTVLIGPFNKSLLYLWIVRQAQVIVAGKIEQLLPRGTQKDLLRPLDNTVASMQAFSPVFFQAGG